MKKMLAAGAALLALGTFALEPGGVSVDLSVLKGGADVGKNAVNLMKCGDFEGKNVFNTGTASWSGGSYVWSNGLKDKAHKQRIVSGHRRFIDPKGGVNGSACAVILTPEKLAAEQNRDGNPWMSNSFSQRIPLPDSNVPVKYALLFKTKGFTGKNAGINSLRVFVHFYDQLPGVYKNLKRTRAVINHAVSLPKDYEMRSLTFMAPPHTRRLDISFTLYGQGTVFLDDVQLVKIEMKKGANVYVTPWSFLDNTYCIGEKQPGTVVFEMQNEQGVKYKKLCLTLKIPAGFKLHSGNVNNILVSEKKNPDGSTTAVFNVQRFVPGMKKDGYGMWSAPSVTLIPQMAKSGKRFPLEYSLSEGEWQGEVKKLYLKVIEPLQGRRPKHFVSGVQLVHEFNLPAEKLPEIRDFLDRAGLNAIHGGSDLLRKSVKNIGLARYAQPHVLCNGYRIGGAANRTEESYFRQVDGKPFKRGMVKTCPVEVYKRGKFYRSQVLTMLEQILVTGDTADQIMPNWEPYYLDFKGCFCDRCREEFIHWMKGKAKEEAVRARWPRQIIDTFKDEWIKFRSWQHGRLCVTLEKDINALGKKAGKDSHFMPEIAWSQLVESDKKGFGQYSPLDYMAELPWLEPWGPYIFSSFTEKYNYYPGIHLITYTAAHDNKAFLKRYIKDPAKYPKLIALPHGFQCGTWVTEPEAFAFETLCFFLQGWEGSFGYYFPKGYDHRYWNALARANSVIADFEEIVMKGEELKGASCKVETPVPRPFFPAYWSEGGNFKKRLPGLAKAEMVQLKSFRNGKNVAVAVGNFWQKGEVFVKVSVRGVDKKVRYTVNSSENYSLGIFSGEELAGGILLHVGALRWNILAIQPGAKTKGEVISQSAIAGMMKKRLPAIKKSLEWEKNYFKKMQDEESADNPVNDFKAVYELNNAGVNLKAVKENGKDYLRLSGAGYTALLDPGAAGRLASLKIGGRELVHSLGFGADGFWAPKKVSFNVVKGFKITGMDKSGNGIRVELARTISAREKSALAGVKITKIWQFNSKGVSVKSVLTNTAAVPVEFAFRFHNIPNHLAGNSGKVFFGKASFFREQSLKIARFGKEDSVIDKMFKVNQFIAAPEKKFSLRAPGLPEVNVALGGAVPYGVIFWDGGTFSTMEPVFNRIKLDPGAKAEFVMSFNW
ncbi:MAG: hypothetical protein IKD44_10005 [Lentisphaeria bacterium]|nr:hypothetical protein [Lentisphaeria bacterium]